MARLLQTYLTMNINAAVFTEANTPFSIETLQLAPPRAGEVLVEMKAAGVCHSDWHLVTGATKFPTPAVPGHEGAGVVVEVGPGVTRVAVGHHITLNWAPHCGLCFYCARSLPGLCATHLGAKWAGTMLDGTTRLSWGGKPVYHFSSTACFAEYTVVPEVCCVPMPEEVPFAVAALIGCAVTTGVGAVLNKAQVQPGSSVAVFGAGGVGLSILMAAELAGADPIIAVDTSPEKLGIALGCGATEALLSGPEANDRIRALTGGRGADYVFEAVGIPALQEQCLDAVRPGGTLILAGISPAGSTTNLPGTLLTRQEKTVAGTYYGSSNPISDFPHIGELYLRNKLRLGRLVSETYPLDRINAAFERMLSGTTARGIIVF